jgi:hypothetical protein
MPSIIAVNESESLESFFPPSIFLSKSNHIIPKKPILQHGMSKFRNAKCCQGILSRPFTVQSLHAFRDDQAFNMPALKGIRNPINKQLIKLVQLLLALLHLWQ